MRPTLSLAVSTLGRSTEIGVLLRSLDQQEVKPAELIIVDQNDDERLAPVLQSHVGAFPIRHIRRPGTRGVNRGRNEGWRLANGDFVLFPDDDCWYPPWFFARALDLAETTGADILTGRAADGNGRNIQGRFAKKPHKITRRNMWVSAIEWTMFIRRTCLETLGGFNEELGPGSATPWGAHEAQDLISRALRQGYRSEYDPSLYGHHSEWDLSAPNEVDILKGRTYARGMGFVLRSAGFSPLSAGYWVMRASANMGLALVRGNVAQSRYYANLAIGRLEGYLKQPLPL